MPQNTNDEPNPGQGVSPPPTRVVVESFPGKWLGLLAFVVNAITLLLVFSYAYTASQQRNDMFEQNYLTQQTVLNQHEPWIGIVEIKPVGNFAVEPKVAWTLENYGDSPARRIIVKVYTVDEKSVRQWKLGSPCHDADMESQESRGETARARIGPPQRMIVGTATVSDLNQRVISGTRYVMVCVSYQDIAIFSFDQNVTSLGYVTDGQTYNLYNTKALYAGETKGNTDAPISSPVDHFKLLDEDTYGPRRPPPRRGKEGFWRWLRTLGAE